MTPTELRSVFISDTHLGNKNAQAQHLLDFLKSCRMQKLFLVGDIIDLREMSRGGHLPKSHQAVLSYLFTLAKSGQTQVYYIPGNHDPLFRSLDGQNIGAIQVEEELVHTLQDGRRLLVVHGDCFDEQIHQNKWMFIIGDLAYTLAVTLNRWLNHLGASLGLRYWSLPGFLKIKSKKAQSYIQQFERLALARAKAEGMQGIICGHIHQAKLAEVDGLIYANDGDWLEGCHALVEHLDGRLEMRHQVKGHQVSHGTLASNHLKPRAS